MAGEDGQEVAVFRLAIPTVPGHLQGLSWTPTNETLYPETAVAVAAGTVVTVSPSCVFARDAADGSEGWTDDAGPPDDATGPRFEGAQPHHLAAIDEIVRSQVAG